MNEKHTNRKTDRAKFERKSWNATFGCKKNGKKYVRRLQRSADKALCRALYS